MYASKAVLGIWDPDIGNGIPGEDDGPEVKTGAHRIGILKDKVCIIML